MRSQTEFMRSQIERDPVIGTAPQPVRRFRESGSGRRLRGIGFDHAVGNEGTILVEEDHRRSG